MTEGISQGLMVVIAVIIFGIFITITYVILNDTFSPKMQGVIDDISKVNEKNTFKMTADSLKRYKTTENKYPNNLKIIERDGYTITFSEEGLDWTEGFFISAKAFEKGKRYILTYTVTDLSGNVSMVGGHIEKYLGNISDGYAEGIQNTFIDGKPAGNYFSGVDFPQDKKPHVVKVVLDTTKWESSFDKTYDEVNAVFIQLNRGSQDENLKIKPFTAKIENIKISEI